MYRASFTIMGSYVASSFGVGNPPKVRSGPVDEGEEPPGSRWSFFTFSGCTDFFCETGTALTSTWRRDTVNAWARLANYIYRKWTILKLWQWWKIFQRNPSYPDLHVGNMHHISVLVFGLHHHGGWPSTAYVVFVQDESRLLGVCVRVRLQPPGQKATCLCVEDKIFRSKIHNSLLVTQNKLDRFQQGGQELGKVTSLINIYLARRPPLELCTHMMKSSRKECSLVWRCRGRFPSRASRMVGEWDRARPFPRIPEWDLHTWIEAERTRIKISSTTQ